MPESQQIANNAIRIMFIGDSWTTGADAPVAKDYPNMLINLIRKKYAGSDIQTQFFNYAAGSFNSSEASFVFLKHYKRIKPTLLIILIGGNNNWNSQDIALANKYFEKELHFGGAAINKINLWDKIFIHANQLKVVKLFKLAYFNLFVAKKELYGPHPKPCGYTSKFFEILGQGKAEKARDYIIENINQALSYDDFYRIMLYTFRYHQKETDEYLKKKGVYKPELIKNKFNQKEHDSYMNAKYKILKEQICYLKNICDLNNIKIILQNYPYYGERIYDEVNVELSDIANELGISFVDHCQLFKDKLGIERWKRLLTHSHVNADGYALMAEDLFNFIEKNDILNCK